MTISWMRAKAVITGGDGDDLARVDHPDMDPLAIRFIAKVGVLRAGGCAGLRASALARRGLRALRGGHAAAVRIDLPPPQRESHEDQRMPSGRARLPLASPRRMTARYPPLPGRTAVTLSRLAEPLQAVELYGMYNGTV